MTYLSRDQDAADNVSLTKMNKEFGNVICNLKNSFPEVFRYAGQIIFFSRVSTSSIRQQFNEQNNQQLTTINKTFPDMTKEQTIVIIQDISIPSGSIMSKILF